MATDSAPCPYCHQPIRPRPRRARKCPHCGGQVYVRHGQLVTEEQAIGAAPPSPAPPAATGQAALPVGADEVRRVVTEVLHELGVGPGETARFARYKTFGSELSPRETAFAKAMAFATEIGPGRVISISHAEDDRGAVVTVWYWAPAYEVESVGP